MAVHVLDRRQIIPTDGLTCWQFFSSPGNLALITPPNLGFKVLGEVPLELTPGMIIRYQVRPLLGIPVTWVTEITHVRTGQYFCDEQRVGPYRMWHHEHSFRELGENRTEVRDLVHYQLPFSPLSEFMHGWVVEPRLREIFAYRAQVLIDRFGSV